VLNLDLNNADCGGETGSDTSRAETIWSLVDVEPLSLLEVATKY
jgi:hypothetical protein